GSPSTTKFLSKNSSGAPAGERNKQILKSLIQQHATMPGEFGLMGTTGDDANHAFNALPKHPSADKLKGGDLDEKIQRELIEPGQKIASTKLSKEQARALYEAQLTAELGKGSDAERDLILA